MDRPPLINITMSPDQQKALAPLFDWLKEHESTTGNLGAIMAQPVGGVFKCAVLTNEEALGLKRHYNALLVKPKKETKEKAKDE